MVARDGIELQGVLITRKLLILRSARRAKKATLPGRRYKIGTKIHSQSNHCSANKKNIRRYVNTAIRIYCEIRFVFSPSEYRGNWGFWIARKTGNSDYRSVSESGCIVRLQDMESAHFVLQSCAFESQALLSASQSDNLARCRLESLDNRDPLHVVE